MTLSALGIFSAAGAGGGPVGDYELIETNILGSNQASITFSNLGTYSSTYKHLQIRATGRNSSSNGEMFLRFNADTGNNYSTHALYADGTGPYSIAASSTSQIRAGATSLSTDASNVFGTTVLDVLDAFSTTKNKTTRSFSGRTGSNQILLISGAWYNTASTTSLTLLTGANNFVTGSRFSLYGIRG
jgi:hypothetical protein